MCHELRFFAMPVLEPVIWWSSPENYYENAFDGVFIFKKVSSLQKPTDFKDIFFSQAYSEPCQVSKIERFSKIVNGSNR